MISTKIKESDIASLKVASLPSRPTAPRSFGGVGFTATEMKQAFDRLPLYIISRFNELIDDIGRVGGDGLSAAIPTGIKEAHTLSDMTGDIKSGAFASYLNVLGLPLTEVISALRESLAALEESSEISVADRAALLERAEAAESAVEALNLAIEALSRSQIRQGEMHAALAAQHEADTRAQDARTEAVENARAADRAVLDRLDALSAGERLSTLEADSRRLGERISAVGAEDMRSRISSLEASTDELDRRISSIDAAGAEARLGELEAETAEHTEKLGTLEAGLTEFGEAVSEIKDAVDSRTDFWDELESIDLPVKIDDIESHIIESESKITALAEARVEDRALLDSVAERLGASGDTIIDCGGPMDLV